MHDEKMTETELICIIHRWIILLGLYRFPRKKLQSNK